jgi:hypothetical protein
MNILLMLVTPEVSHAPMSWLKDEALSNMESIVVTLEVSHAPMSWLKAEASWNMPSIVVTPEVSHAPMSSLKDAAASLQSSSSAQNKYDMSVTPPVAHEEMWPYVASASAW